MDDRLNDERRRAPHSSFIIPHSSLNSAPAPVFQYLRGGVAARGAHDAAAGVRGRAAHVEVADGRAVLRPAGRGPQEEELFEGEFALKDVALGESEVALDVERRQNLPVEDQLAEV